MFPFIQCHQTRGRAALGGFSNPFFNASSDAWEKENPAAQMTVNTATENRLQARFIIPISPRCFFQAVNAAKRQSRERKNRPMELPLSTSIRAC
jgi:hypothetical protein